MKEFLKKFWHFIAIGFLSVATVVLIIVMCVCMVPKGKGGGNGGDGGDKGGQLEAPQNVQIVADRVLVWDEVLNAGGGYTVKINDDETTSVTKNYLDLSAESLKTIIVSGSNTISVKANAHGSYTASAYSDPITYELVLTPAEEAAAYVRLVEAIDTITADSEYSVALTVQTKIDEAKDYYQAMSLEALALENVTAAKASFDTKKSAYDTVMETAQTAYTAFRPSLTEATAEITKEESLTALSEKAAAAETAYEGLSTLAKGMLTEDESTAYASLATTVTAWEEAIEDAKEEWEGITFTKGTDSDETAEEVIATVNGLLKDYEDYPAYVQAGITTEIKTAAETALDDAKDQIAETVSELQATVVEISGKIESNQINDTNLEEHYEALAEIQEKELGAYAKELWDEAKDEGETALDLTNMLKDSLDYLLAIPCEEDSTMRIFVFGATGKVTILYTATNIKGDPIEKTPTLSVTIEATTPSPENPTFTQLSNGVYSYECEFTQLNADDYNYTLAVAYSINGVEKQKSTKYKANMDPFFIAANGYKAIVDDKITYDAGEAYFDIYLDGDIEFSTSNNDALPTIKNLPLLTKVSVESGMTVEEFRRQIAKAHPELIGKEYDVRFVVYRYGTQEGSSDIVHLSCIKSDRVSHDTYHLDLVESDTKTPISTNSNTIFDTGVYSATEHGDFTLITNANVEAFLTQFHDIGELSITKSNVEEYLQILITAYDEETDEFLFSTVAPFKNRGYDYFTFMNKWAYDHFGKDGADNYSVEFYLTLTIQPKAGTKVAELFLDSTSVNVSKGGPYDGTYTFHKAEVSSPTKAQLSFKEAGAVTFVRDANAGQVESVYGGNGKVFDEANHVQYIEVLFTKSATLEGKDTEGAGFYRFYLIVNPTDNHVIGYKDLNKKENPLETNNTIADSYMSLSNFVEWIQNNFTEANFSQEEAWYFYTKVVVDVEELDYLYQGGYSEALACPTNS